ncbi:hypothetical protein BWI96_10470 [Siphonobacter sp. SORGH_AS_0500]|uniref:DUF2958 domain-containing protein n=1 Tax=Siphonobacter sp. SORGH_AS_0500 TaxID=1864824 RepID=UPI000CC610CF|nr:DUF2958 domain-containing protein [Siphonobacter sp. SORGH_AS_0500]PKK36786.1 hypothetical protein BWI96_10470 [Siphonobacter sp. SORGH_AS_0500]
MSDLLSRDLKERMLINGQDHLDGNDVDRMPVVKLFTPFGRATWILTELNPMDPDIAFGLCDLGFGSPELGYVSIFEMESVIRFGMPAIEIDKHFTPEDPLSVYAEAARLAGRITEDPNLLKRAAVNCLMRLSDKKLPKPDR